MLTASERAGDVVKEIRNTNNLTSASLSCRLFVIANCILYKWLTVTRHRMIRIRNEYSTVNWLPVNSNEAQQMRNLTTNERNSMSCWIGIIYWGGEMHHLAYLIEYFLLLGCSGLPLLVGCRRRSTSLRDAIFHPRTGRSKRRRGWHHHAHRPRWGLSRCRRCLVIIYFIILFSSSYRLSASFLISK